MEPLKLANSTKEWLFILFALSIVFSINLFHNYELFKKLKSDEISENTGKIINIYPKEKNNILKIETTDFTFFTSSPKDLHFEKFQSINFILVTEKIKFIDYLKGFFAPTFNIETTYTCPTIVENINNSITSQHSNKLLGELFNTLFLATPPIHQRYFPYRNKKLDSLIVISILLFIYLLALNTIPSFLRSFMMFIVGIFLLRSNIKILSFGSLGIITLLIIALFPKLLFSLSLWFSVIGVFYIFLFMQYFSKLNKIFGFVLFNFWIFFAVNPITHFFFGTTSLVQLLSPIITIGFIIFYPLELILHLLNLGGLFDTLLLLWLNTNPYSYNVFSPLWVLIAHIVVSLLSIKYKWSFYLLNISLVIFALFLYI
ncbi:MAG: ComEC/Rec2 family competence protein [Arcobacter sp.]|nr:ComEC/Rec2 family competence protein [Arcobacter sp.]